MKVGDKIVYICEGEFHNMIYGKVYTILDIDYQNKENKDSFLYHLQYIHP